MFNGGHILPAIEHLRAHTPSKMGPPLYLVPIGFNTFRFYIGEEKLL